MKHPLHGLSKTFIIGSCLLLSGSLLAGCGQQEDNPAPLKLDTAYLESEAYRNFQERLQQELARTTSEQELINMAVAEVYSRTQRHLRLPARFTTASLADYTDSGNRIILKSSELNSSVYGEFSYYPVGKTRKGDFTVLFFLLRRNSIPDIEMDMMIATVAGNGTVRSARSVAPFKRAVAGPGVSSQVEITHDLRIVSRIHDSGSASIASASIVYRDFQVREDGRIVDISYEP